MKILLAALLAVLLVACATLGIKHSNPGVEVTGIAKISECGNLEVAINVAFQDAANKLRAANCEEFVLVAIGIFPLEDKVLVVLRGEKCNPPRRV